MHDSSLTIGTLPNGMRYYIRANRRPAKRAMVWLAVNAGAIQEDDDQRGLAHFLEHMAFNGTKHFPHNNLIDVIQRAGMTFGGDLNAYTSFDETVYQLTIPTDDAAVFRQGLQIVQDWASGDITMDSSDVIGERGVVLGEWRARNPDTAGARFQQEDFERRFGVGSRYTQRLPIGLPASIETAQPAVLTRFYRDWYRPDLMAIIVVGDVNPADVEREIQTRFGAIPAPVNPRPFTRPEIPRAPGTVVHVIKDKVSPSVTVTWPAPLVPASAEAAIHQELVEELVFQRVNRILTKQSRQLRRPFVLARTGRTRGLVRSMGDQYTVQVLARPDSLENGLASVLTEFERIAQYGIPTTVFASQKAALLRELEHEAAAESAVPSRAIASAYIKHYLTDAGHLLSAAQRLALAQHIMPTLTQEIVAHAAQFWRDSSRTVTVMLPQFAHVRPPTRESVLAHFDSVSQRTLSADVPSDANIANDSQSSGSASNTLLLSTLPKSGTIVREQVIDGAGVTMWTLSNGARVLYKHTTNDPDEVLLQATSLGGTSKLPDSLLYGASRLVAMLMTADGGLGAQNREQLEQQLNTTAAKNFRVEINAFDERIAVGGSPRELETLFQMLYLQFTAPKIDTAAVKGWKRYGILTLNMSPNDQLAIRNGAPITPPSPTLVPLFEVSQGMAVYHDRFGDASDFTFTIVGAAVPEQVKPFVQRYIASLPSTSRTEREQPKRGVSKAFEGALENIKREPGVPVEKALTLLMFRGALPDTPDAYLRERQQLDALSWILSRRLLNRLREKMAVTYSVGAQVQTYMDPQSKYVLTIQYMTAPDRMDDAVKAVWEEIESIRTAGTTTEELAMIAAVQKRREENALQDNKFWEARLIRFDQLGLPLTQVNQTVVAPLTSNDVQRAAQQYLPKEKYIQQTVLPMKKDIEATKAKKTPPAP